LLVIKTCEKRPRDLPGCICIRPDNDHDIHLCRCDFSWADEE
jgi:hypothetical protein